jgi:myosin heavy subunit
LKNIDDAEAMREVREAFHTLSFSKYEMLIFKAIAAILHLGNITFSKDDSKGMEGVKIDQIQSKLSEHETDQNLTHFSCRHCRAFAED